MKKKRSLLQSIKIFQCLSCINTFKALAPLDTTPEYICLECQNNNHFTDLKEIHNAMSLLGLNKLLVDKPLLTIDNQKVFKGNNE